MFSMKDVDEVIPCSIKLVINCDMDEISFDARMTFNDITEKHNADHDEKVETLTYYFHTDDENFAYHNYEFYIGKKKIMEGKIDEEIGVDGLFPIFEKILENFHDSIIEQQKKNEEKLLELEYENNDELLYVYYDFYENKRAFYFLKKLAEKYPNSRFTLRLEKEYIEKNPVMFAKMYSTRKGYEENF